MNVIADILMIAGALGAAFYCVVLSRRLSRFTDLEKGVGGAIAVLSAQVDDMTRALRAAQGSAQGSTHALEELTGRADGVARRLELLVASMHDLPEVTARAPAAPAPAAAPTAPPPLAEAPAPAGPLPESPDAPAPDTNVSLFRSRRAPMLEAAE